MKLRKDRLSLPGMSERDKGQTSSQPDKDLAAKERPKPSQAEGDAETVEEDLKQAANKKEKDSQQG